LPVAGCRLPVTSCQLEAEAAANWKLEALEAGNRKLETYDLSRTHSK
jgi:hypothetical protein